MDLEGCALIALKYVIRRQVRITITKKVRPEPVYKYTHERKSYPSLIIKTIIT